MSRHRQREFSDTRSRFSSLRSYTEYEPSVRSVSRVSIGSMISGNLETTSKCVTCVNKQLCQSRKQKAQQKLKQQTKEHMETIRAINMMRDLDKQRRQKEVKQNAIYNLSIMEHKNNQKELSKKEGQIYISRVLEQEAQKERQDDIMRQSRVQEKTKYYEALKQQMELQKRRKQRQKQQRLNQSPSKLKVLEQNEKYRQMVQKEKKNCLNTVKSQIIQNSIQKQDSKQIQLLQSRKHIETVEKEFSQFTEFQPLESSPYKTSRMLFNPEQDLDQLKKSEALKKTRTQTERTMNNEQRIKQLKRQADENRKATQMKISSMKKYVEDLTGQVLSRRKREEAQKKIDQKLMQTSSKLDQITEEKAIQTKTCSGCSKERIKAYF